MGRVSNPLPTYQAGYRSMAFEVLHFSFVFLSRFPGFERAQVPSLTGFGILLPGVQAVFPGFEFSDQLWNLSVPVRAASILLRESSRSMFLVS